MFAYNAVKSVGDRYDLPIVETIIKKIKAIPKNIDRCISVYNSATESDREQFAADINSLDRFYYELARIKNDADIYVPQATFDQLLIEQPAGYELNRELDENGKEKWIRPQEGYLVLTNLTTGDHIDTQSVDDSHKSTEVEIDGKMVRVQSLTDQINDKIRLMFETDGLKGIPIDPIHNPDPISKYGVYAQYILEMADSERGQAELAKHADELPEDWRETMEIMASQGEYGKPVSQEKRDAFQEKMEAWKKSKQMQDQMVSDLRDYYESNHDKAPEESSVELPSLMEGFEGIVNEALGESSSSNDFIQKIIGRMSDSEKKAIKDRIKSLAMKSDT